MLFKIILGILALYLYYLLFGLGTTLLIRMRNPLKQLDHSSKRLFLTFDDGVNPEYTPMLLELLEEYQIKATFFILAKTAEENPLLVQRMKNEGHVIGFHSYKHDNQILQLPHSIKRDFEKSMDTSQKLGVPIEFYRPPWGHCRLLGLHICKKLGLKMVLWNVIVQDWEKDTSVELLCTKLTKKIHGNAVVCMHDGRGKNNAPLKTIGALKEMIPVWKEEGYVFETVDKLFKKDYV